MVISIRDGAGSHSPSFLVLCLTKILQNIPSIREVISRNEKGSFCDKPEQ